MTALSPSEYLEIIIAHAGSVYKLSRASGVSHQLIYKKRKKNYPIGTNIFSYRDTAEALVDAVDGLINVEDLCQKKRRRKKNIEKHQNKG
jgi:hypothetical protein